MITPTDPTKDLFIDCPAGAQQPCDCSGAYCVQLKTIYADKLWEGFGAFWNASNNNVNFGNVVDYAGDLSILAPTGPCYQAVPYNGQYPLFKFNGARLWSVLSMVGTFNNIQESALYQITDPGHRPSLQINKTAFPDDPMPTTWQFSPVFQPRTWSLTQSFPGFTDDDPDFPSPVNSLSGEMDINATIAACYAAIDYAQFASMGWNTVQYYRFKDYGGFWLNGASLQDAQGLFNGLNLGTAPVQNYIALCDGSKLQLSPGIVGFNAGIPASYAYFGTLSGVNKTFVRLAASQVKASGEYLLIQYDFYSDNSVSAPVIIAHGFAVPSVPVFLAPPSMVAFPEWKFWPQNFDLTAICTAIPAPAGRVVRFISGCNPQGFIAHNPTATIAPGVN